MHRLFKQVAPLVTRQQPQILMPSHLNTSYTLGQPILRVGHHSPTMFNPRRGFSSYNSNSGGGDFFAGYMFGSVVGSLIGVSMGCK